MLINEFEREWQSEGRQQRFLFILCQIELILLVFHHAHSEVEGLVNLPYGRMGRNEGKVTRIIRMSA